MNNYKRTTYASYLTSFSTAFTGNFTPLLFFLFKNVYGLSYTALGFLIVLNYGTQLLFDLFFSCFSKKLPMQKIAKLPPLFMAIGLTFYGFVPFLFKNNIFLGLAICTILQATGNGTSEVLTSPIIAAIPFENPGQAMAKLHSSFAWGVVTMVPFTTLYLKLFGSSLWYILPWIYALLPLVAWILYLGEDLPLLRTNEENVTEEQAKSKFPFPLFVLCIILGGATECTMSGWASLLLEETTGLDKTLCDIFGVALFGFFLALGRSLYGKRGKNIKNTLLFCFMGCLLLYLLVGLSSIPVLSLLACALCGFSASMLWPGSLNLLQEELVHPTVSQYAWMAAGGDLGASLIPQLVGMVSDASIEHYALSEAGGMRVGILCATICPFIGICLMAYFIHHEKTKHV